MVGPAIIDIRAVADDRGSTQAGQAGLRSIAWPEAVSEADNDSLIRAGQIVLSGAVQNTVLGEDDIAVGVDLDLEGAENRLVLAGADLIPREYGPVATSIEVDGASRHQVEIGIECRDAGVAWPDPTCG